MALDFPTSPSTGQTYAGPGGIVWQWDGTKWVNGAGLAAYAPIASPVFTGNPQAPTPPVGDADTSVPTTAFVAAAVAPAFNGVGRNLIHNPLFNVAQRAGPFTSGYTADRWQISLTTDTVSWAIGALSDAQRTVIGDEAAVWGLANTFTGNAAAGAYNVLTQKIEDVRRLSNKTVTVSFWAWCGAGTLKLGVNLTQLMGTGGSPSATVSVPGIAVTLSTTPTRYALSLTAPSIIGKTLGSNNDHSTQLGFWCSAGATLASNSGSVGVQSGTIQLWGVQLEIGSVATPLEKPDPRYDLANCQRFYQLVTITSIVNNQLATGQAQASAAFATTMRASPTVNIQSNTSVNLTTVSVGGDTRSANLFGTTTANGSTQFVATLTASADL